MKDPHFTPGNRAAELLRLRRLLESGELTREEYASRLNWTQNDAGSTPEKSEPTQQPGRLNWNRHGLFPVPRSRLPDGLAILRRALLAPMIRNTVLTPVASAPGSPWWLGERLIWPAALEGKPPRMPQMPCGLELDLPPPTPVQPGRKPAASGMVKSAVGVLGGSAFAFAGVSDLAGDHLATGLGLLLCAGGLFLLVLLPDRRPQLTGHKIPRA